MSITLVYSIVLALIVGACAPEPQTAPESRPSVPVVTVDPAHTLGVQSVEAGAALEDAATPDTVTDSDCPEATGAAAQYVLDATLDWMAHTVSVTQYVTFRNDTGQALKSVVFNVEPNRDDGFFALRRVSVEGAPADGSTLADVRLEVPLSETLTDGCTVDIELVYDVTLPAIANGYRKGHLGYWGYSARQINLGMWFPLVAAYDATQQWLSPMFHEIGEHYVLRTGDFDLTLRVKNAPEDVRAACPGTVEQVDDHTWHVELTSARELTVSLSNAFNTLTTTTEIGVEVVLYYFYDTASESLDAPRHALYVAADALVLFDELYGPYPYARMVVVAGDFPDGMEFSGLVFVSEDWFRVWTGAPTDWLTIITAHEIAHQWWYNVVGNAQAADPYLDEALAMYSELLFFERYYAEHVTWWWDFRVHAYGPVGRVDATVYDFTSPRAYINAVYLRGALMIQDMREALGDTAFFDWLQRYYTTYKGQVAYPRDFWGTFGDEDYTAMLGIRQTYLSYADVLMTNDDIP